MLKQHHTFLRNLVESLILIIGMLSLYFFHHFVKRSLLFFFFLCLVFAGSDLMIRLTAGISPEMLIRFFFEMLPLMAQFALPLAIGLAVQTVTGELFMTGEILFMHYFASAKMHMYVALMTCSLVGSFFYVPLVFSWAPMHYWQAKQVLLSSVKEQLLTLSAGSFHTLSDKFTFFFKKKIEKGKVPIFYNVFIACKDKEGHQYILTAKRCKLACNNLMLLDGIVYGTRAMSSTQEKKRYIARFAQLNMLLEQFITLGKERSVKFLTVHQLIQNLSDDPAAFIEYHKRIAQVIWFFFFPFIAFWTLCACAPRQNSLLYAIALSGGVFLISYLIFQSTFLLIQWPYIALYLVYGLSLLQLVISYIWYIK